MLSCSLIMFCINFSVTHRDPEDYSRVPCCSTAVSGLGLVCCSCKKALLYILRPNWITKGRISQLPFLHLMLYNSLDNPAGVRLPIAEDQLFLIPEEGLWQPAGRTSFTLL